LAPTIEFSAISDRIKGAPEPAPAPVSPSARRTEAPPARRPESVQLGRRPAGASTTPSRLARAAVTAERQIPQTPARSSGASSVIQRPRREGNLAWLWFVLLLGLAVSAFYLLTK